MPNMGIYTNALFSKTQQRVLAVLFGQAHRSFYANEIIALAESGSGAVQRELTRLEAASLITAQRIGNQKHYQANKDAPIFEELRSIVLKTFGVSDVIASGLQDVWSNIELAFIYGSVAKGSEHAASDIDLMIVADNLSNAELITALESSQTQLGRMINPTLYTKAEFAQRITEGRSFITRVMEQPKIFIKGSADDITGISSASQLSKDQ
jgi:predicted nucleotidyltransferase